MRKFDCALANKITGLRLRGVSHKQIAKRLGISVGSAFNYTRGLSLSGEAELLLKNNEERNWQAFSKKFAVPHQIKYPELSEDLAFVLGHLFFDGSVYVSKANTNRYIAKYTNSSMELINRFNETATRLFGIAPLKLQRNPGKNLPWFETYFSSKNLYDWLVKISPSFSTSQSIGVPEMIQSAEDRILCDFLQAFWDDEGSIGCCGALTGFSKSEKMIDDLVYLHQKLGISCKKRGDANSKIFSIYIKRSLSNYCVFSEKIGFTSSIVKSGANLGKCKQTVLTKQIQKMASF